MADNHEPTPVLSALLAECDRVYYDVLLPHEQALIKSLIQLQQDEAHFVMVLDHARDDRSRQYGAVQQAQADAVEARLRAALLLGESDDNDDDYGTTDDIKAKKIQKPHDDDRDGGGGKRNDLHDDDDDDDEDDSNHSGSSSDDDDSAFGRLKNALLTMEDDDDDEDNNEIRVDIDDSSTFEG